jgi:hypothetical protein
MRVAIVLTIDLALTLLACGAVGPAASKFNTLGLAGWAMRAPFYLLRLYIGPMLLLLGNRRDWYLWGILTGTALSAPLAFWAIVPGCPRVEPFANLLAGALQGLILGWVVHHFYPDKALRIAAE